MKHGTHGPWESVRHGTLSTQGLMGLMYLVEVIGPMALTVSTKITGLMESIEIFMEA